MSLTSSAVFDHLIHVVPDVAAAARECTAVGLRAKANPPHDGYQNGGWNEGLRYVELFTVHDQDEFAGSQYGPWAQAFLPAIRTGLAAGGGAFTMGFEVPDVPAAVESMRARGIPADLLRIVLQRGDTEVSYEIGWPTAGPQWRPFVITYPSVWPKTRAERVEFRSKLDTEPASPFDLRELVVETADPRAGAHWMAAVLDLPEPAESGTSVAGPGWRMAGFERDLLFVEGSAERVTTVVLDGADAPDLTIAGLRYRPS